MAPVWAGPASQVKRVVVVRESVETPTAHSKNPPLAERAASLLLSGPDGPGGAGLGPGRSGQGPAGNYLFASLFLFTYAQIFFVMTEGPMGELPMIFSMESLQPLKLIAYPPNAAFPLLPFLFFAIPFPPSNRLWGLRPAPPDPAEGIMTGLRGRAREKYNP